MLRWLRLRASPVAAAVLVSFGAIGLSLFVAHDGDCHDIDCHLGVPVHDASAHQFDAEPQDTASEPFHCLVCHWVRSFRPHPEVVFVAAPAAAAGIWINVEIFTAAPIAPAAQPPLRSPPASPALS
jgi:hypothetical protein